MSAVSVLFHVQLRCDAAGCTEKFQTAHVFAVHARKELSATGWRTGIAVIDPGPPVLDYCLAHSYLARDDSGDAGDVIP